MSRRKSPRPIIGCAFDPEQNNTQENFRAIAGELRYYRPRGSSDLARELERYAAEIESGDTSRDWAQIGLEAEDEAFRLLSAMAEQRAPGAYLIYDRDGGFCGFRVALESFEEDADLSVSDLSEVPRGFSGLVRLVNDHGNVSGYRYSRGRSRELFAVV